MWKEYLSTEDSYHFFFSLRCVFRPPRELDTESICKAAFLLDSGLRNSEGVPDAYYAALGDCYWRLHKDLECADTWQTRGVHYLDPVAKEFSHQCWKEMSKPSEPEVTEPKLYFMLVSAEIIVGITDAWDRSGHVDDAIRWLKGAIEKQPKTKHLNRRLGELFAREHRFEEACDYLLREMEVNPDFGNDPVTQLALVLGQKLQKLMSLEHAQALARSPGSRPQRTAIEGVLPVLWPAYAQLTAEAREHWLDACLMFHGRPDPGMPDETRHLYAAMSAALAAEVELRNFVFKPFRKNLSEESLRLTEKWIDPNLRAFRLFLRGVHKPSLGEMLNLLWVAESPADELQKVFAREVQSGLGSNLRKMREARWKDIIEYRADAVHEGSITAEEAARLLALAKEFLETLHAPSAPSGGAVRGTPSPGTPIRR
jgi:tetratricopeptide (TPR) repeat protein